MKLISNIPLPLRRPPPPVDRAYNLLTDYLMEISLMTLNHSLSQCPSVSVHQSQYNSLMSDPGAIYIIPQSLPQSLQCNYAPVLIPNVRELSLHDTQHMYLGTCVTSIPVQLLCNFCAAHV